MPRRAAVTFPSIVIAAAGGALLSTVTATGGDVVVLPAASLARAVIVCGPGPAWVVSHVVVNGAVVTGAPTWAPSTSNPTSVTATLSVAVAESRTRPDTVAPASGSVTVTPGAVVSGAGGAGLAARTSTAA